MPAIAREPAWTTAIGLFEAGRYWDAHEALEPWWLASEGTSRAWAAGVILLCAALHKARAMGSTRGGRRNYAKALRHLAVVPDHFEDTDVRALEGAVHAALGDAAIVPRWPWLKQEAP